MWAHTCNPNSGVKQKVQEPEVGLGYKHNKSLSQSINNRKTYQGRKLSW